MTNVVVIGKIFKDPETKQTKTGKTMTTFTVQSKTAKKKNPEDKYYISNFYKCTVWTIPDWQKALLVNGAEIIVCGTLTADAYTTKNGEAAPMLSVDNVSILEIKAASEAPTNTVSTKNKPNYEGGTPVEEEGMPF